MIEGLLYRPLALLPAHATAMIERFRVLGSGAPAAFAEDASQRESRRQYDVVAGIAVVPIMGVLVHGGCPWWGETSYAEVRQQIRGAYQDPDVSAIVLHVDSPGGEVAGCFDLADDIYAMRGDKPIIAIVDEYCCSAAYALASSADRIIAPRTAVIGSIGVITMHMDITSALDQAGVKITTVQFGDRKSDSYPTTPLSDDAHARMQAEINKLGALFVALVARNRGIDQKAVRATQAGVFIGDDAVETGLADRVMAPDAAFCALVEAASQPSRIQ